MAQQTVSSLTEDRFVPGSVHLVDLGSTLKAKHASGNQRDVLLVPAPSSHADDPLNWSAWRKAQSTACIAMYVQHLSLVCLGELI